MSLKIVSRAFAHGKFIPDKYTCNDLVLWAIVLGTAAVAADKSVMGKHVNSRANTTVETLFLIAISVAAVATYCAHDP